MKRIILSALSILCLFSARAQSDYMSNSFVSENTEMFLGGKAGLTILSPHNDLVIEVIPKTPLYAVSEPVAEGAHFRYDVELSLEENAKATTRQFKVSRRGKTVYETIQETIGENKRKTYRVEEVANPITVEKNTDRVGLGSTNAEEACVEIVTPIDLTVTCGPNLPHKISKQNQANGSILISIMVNQAEAKTRAQEFFNVMKEYHALMEKDNNDQATDAELDRLDELEKTILPPLRKKYNDMVTISFRGEGTNERAIVLGDENGINLNAKERIAYTVLLLKETVYKTAFHQYTENAKQERSKLMFQKAIAFYEQALAAADKPAGQDSLIMTQIADCKEYDKHNQQGLQMLVKYSELKKQTTVKESEVMKYLEGAANCFDVLYQKCGEEQAKERFQQVSKALENLPWVIEGVVKAGRLKGGVLQEQPVSGCEVSFYDRLKNERKELGTTDSNGKYHVELNKASTGTLHFQWFNGKKLLTHNIYFGAGDREHVSWDVHFKSK